MHNEKSTDEIEPRFPIFCMHSEETNVSETSAFYSVPTSVFKLSLLVELLIGKLSRLYNSFKFYFFLRNCLSQKLSY